MNHPEVIRLCRELLRAVERPQAGLSNWSTRAQLLGEELLAALQAPDPTCGALLLNAEVAGVVHPAIRCERAIEHEGNHGICIGAGAWYEWPKQRKVEADSDGSVPIQVKP